MKAKKTRMGVGRHAGLVIGLLVFCGLGILLMPSAGHDDSAITAWAAQALAKYGRILNVNGKPLEQSSSLGQVMLQALLIRAFNWPSIFAGKVLSLMGGLLGLGLIYRLSSQQAAGWKFAPVWGMLMLTLAVPYAYWSMGGLETTLIAFAWLWFSQAAASTGQKRGWVAFAGASMLAFFSRPEAPLIGLAVLATFAVLQVLLWFGNQKTRSDQAARPNWAFWAVGHLRQMATPALVFAAIVAFRLTIFGTYLPQPARAKVGGVSLAGVQEGLAYWAQNVFSPMLLGLTLLFVLASVWAGWVVWRRKRLNPQTWLPILLVWVGFGFVVLSGGDWMEGSRFIVPYLPLMVLAGLRVARWLARTGLGRVALAGLLLLQGVGYVRFLNTSSLSLPAWQAPGLRSFTPTAIENWLVAHNAPNVRDIEFIPHLEQVIADRVAAGQVPVRVMSGQMGYVPYSINQKYYGQVIWMDRNSLVDDAFTACPVAQQWERTNTGWLRVNYNQFEKNFAALHSECAIGQPDVVFELDYLKGQVVDNGFTLVYEESGFVDGVGLGKDNSFSKGQFIAVRDPAK